MQLTLLLGRQISKHHKYRIHFQVVTGTVGKKQAGREVESDGASP